MQSGNDVSKRLDLIALLCLALIAIGWFGMDTLVVSFGRFTQNTRFYELGVVIAHPTALFVGVGTSHSIELTMFVILALAALFAVLAAPVLSAQRAAWLAGWLPLALMLICFAVLYGNGAGAQAPPAVASSGIHDDLMRLANHVLQRTEDVLVSHIGIGAGGVLALLASLALAVRSTLNFRATGELPALLTFSAIIA